MKISVIDNQTRADILVANKEHNENMSLDKDELIHQLNDLQTDSQQVLQLVQSTRIREYTNLAQIYAWWIEAVKIEGLLEELYETAGTRRVNETGAEISFRRLLHLVFIKSGIDKDALDRKNRALICIHEEYSRKKELYENDTVIKLASYVKSNGGIGGLIKKNNMDVEIKNQSQESIERANHLQSNADTKDNKDAYARPSDQPKTIPGGTAASASNASFGNCAKTPLKHSVPISQLNRQKVFAEDAEIYLCDSDPTKFVQMTTPIETDHDDLALALIKRVGNKYEIIGSMLPTKNIVQEVMASTYSKDFKALPNLVRPLLETIKTQSLPANVARVFETFAMRELEKTGSAGEYRYKKRIAYLSANNSLLLSSISEDSSVVTRAKLRTPFLASDAGDYQLPVRCVKLLEHRLLACNDFNLFKPTTDQLVEVNPRLGVNSHTLRLNNKVSSDIHMNLDFWRFEQEFGDGCVQVDFSGVKNLAGNSQFLITADEFKAFAFDHCNKWLSSYGDYINRPAHNVVCIAIGQQGLVLQYELENGQFNNQGTTSIASSGLNRSTYSANFLACDLLVSISGIAALDIEGNITINGLSDALVIEFATSVAEFCVAIPTATANGRSVNAFTKYKANVAKGSGRVSADQLQDPEYREWVLQNNAVVSDEVLEQVLGIEGVDYDDTQVSGADIPDVVTY